LTFNADMNKLVIVTTKEVNKMTTTAIKTPVRVDTFTNHVIASVIINGTNYMASVYDFNNGFMSEHICKATDMGMQTISESDFPKANLGSIDGQMKRYAKCILQSAIYKDCKIKV